jgi:hypothetical protein
VATQLKYQQIDFSVPKMIEPYIIIVPWPKEESRLLAPIRPFQPMVWIWLGISILILTPFLTFLSGFYLRFIAPNAKKYPEGSNVNMIRRSILDFAGLLHNGSFLLSHITNQGNSFLIINEQR